MRPKAVCVTTALGCLVVFSRLSVAPAQEPAPGPTSGTDRVLQLVGHVFEWPRKSVSHPIDIAAAPAPAPFTYPPYPPVTRYYRFPHLGYRSYLPFWPGPIAERYTSDRYADRIPANYKFCAYPCRYVYPKALYNIPEVTETVVEVKEPQAPPSSAEQPKEQLPPPSPAPQQQTTPAAQKPAYR